MTADAASLDFRSAGGALLRQLHALAPWDVWIISRRDADGRYRVLQVTENPWGVDEGVPFGWSESLCSRRVLGAPVQTDDVAEAEGYRPAAAIAAQLGIRSYVGMTINRPDGEVFGTVCALHREQATAAPATLAALEAGTTMLQTILSLEHTLTSLRTRAAEAEHRASHDPLTGLLNRRGLGSVLADVGRHAAGLGDSPAVIALDVDGLKQVNDREGHAAGDVVLADVAQTISRTAPAGAATARIGGDEFVVVIPDVSASQVEVEIERLRAALATASVRVSIAGAVMEVGESVADLMRRADAAMYADKPHRDPIDISVSPVRAAAVRAAAVPAAGWIAAASASADGPVEAIRELLERSRQHLGLDVLFVGRWADGQRYFEYVATQHENLRGLEGSAAPLEETYCQPIVAGDVPRAIPDAQAEPSVQGIALTHDLGIGVHLGTPLYLPDGELYGTICGASFTADSTINARDADFLDFVAEVVGGQVDRLEQRGRRERWMAEGLAEMVRAGEPQIVVQPVVDLTTGKLVGVEALSRFSDDSVGPDVWFSRAEEVGMGEQVELAAVGAALAVLSQLPPDVYLAVNASPEVACSAGMLALLGGVDATRVVVELTEHLPWDDDGSALAALRARGVRIAVDDTGAGHAGLQRLLRVEPDVIKIDRTIVSGVADDPAKQAMIKALRDFARSIGASLIAEGVEETVDASALRVLGVKLGQGWAFGRPVSPSAIAAVTSA